MLVIPTPSVAETGEPALSEVEGNPLYPRDRWPTQAWFWAWVGRPPRRKLVSDFI